MGKVNSKESPLFTQDAYLEFDKENGDQPGSFNGNSSPKPEGDMLHNELINNSYMVVRKAMAGSGCKIYTESIKLIFEESQEYLFPDLIATRDQSDLMAHDGIRNPILIAEIVSEESEKRDKIDKFERYIKIPSLTYYLLISQNKPLVSLYQRLDQQWIYQSWDKLADQIYLSDWKCELSLSDIYADIFHVATPAKANTEVPAMEDDLFTGQIH